MKRTRVLIVDDSVTIRRLLAAVLSRDETIEVVGSAPDAASARQMIKDLNPDVITLDVEMPNMNGLEFLEKIMRLRPMPVVMVSTLTQKGAEVTVSALELGAVDYFAKPTDNVGAHLEERARELCEKVRIAASAHVRPYVRKDRTPAPDKPDFDPGNSVVAIGSSTGGVEALIEVLSHFPKNCPATVITQHMPPHFTTSFADRLDRLCQPKVSEAKDGAILAPGQIYLAPGGEAHLEIHGKGTLRCRLVRTGPVNGHRPSVDVLFNSVAKAACPQAIGVILTGMGRDGADGLLAMRKAGAATIGQDEASSVVYGMPRVAMEIGAVEKQYALHQIGQEVMTLCEARQKAGRHAVTQ
ncbi:two-component system chemotaxis response regulator CheB [Rhizomicrobium palustre]|uniref:Protein-glutamate methylesterase/protein-glutamine glutaminase n=1 Tax=Rhizomicrobium palustre TaxID=189966 RepID=A0A846N174_9PROT|nr:chemotaxis response regulator protein-glutamate methylesterase [Rhizomicrobium palustre]NIK89239.1 two-component system chemotaxis response regulator CheB [Rhizomicrobium palustre]